MAAAQLASNGYRIAKSWQYEDGLPEPPSPVATFAADNDNEVPPAGGGARLIPCAKKMDSFEERPLLGSSGQNNNRKRGSDGTTACSPASQGRKGCNGKEEEER